jgi:hypothetical protein
MSWQSEDPNYQFYLTKKGDGMARKRELQARKRKYAKAINAFKSVKRTEPHVQYKVQDIVENDGEAPRILVQVKAPYVRRKRQLFKRFEQKLMLHPDLNGVVLTLIRRIPKATSG